jgi:antitoxin YefM
MEAISYTSVRNNLAKTIDKVNEDHAPIIITRQNGSSAVLMSLEDFNAYEETAYLMRSPANAARLSKAVVDVAKGKFKARKPIERD